MDRFLTEASAILDRLERLQKLAKRSRLGRSAVEIHVLKLKLTDVMMDCVRIVDVDSDDDDSVENNLPDGSRGTMSQSPGSSAAVPIEGAKSKQMIDRINELAVMAQLQGLRELQIYLDASRTCLLETTHRLEAFVPSRVNHLRLVK